ncbi:thioredoxin 1 [Pancytospora philotis]|nr:thioredoxin 1 [Pancytospora philotis]
MVVQAQSKPQAAPEVRFITPESVGEITKSSYKKYIIKFSSTTCRPCHALEQWLRTEYKPKTLVPIYTIVSDANESVAETMFGMYSVQVVPTMVFIDTTSDAKDKVIGFKKPEIEANLNKYFG